MVGYGFVPEGEAQVGWVGSGHVVLCILMSPEDVIPRLLLASHLALPLWLLGLIISCQGGRFPQKSLLGN